MAAAVIADDARTKVQAILTTLDDRFVERQAEALTMVLALLARKHWIGFGPPGTAKSKMVRTIAACIGDLGPEDYFEYLLTGYSTPEELFGLFALSKMQHDRYERVLDGKMARARFVFLDEVFRGGEGILNTLLAAVNERVFHNPEPIEIPLNSLYGASNSFPEGQELEAFYDRLHFRHVISMISEAGAFVQMLQLSRNLPPITPVLSWNELTAAQDEVRKVVVTQETYEALAVLRGALAERQIRPSDRRYDEAVDIIQANAWLAGRPSTSIPDIYPLQHVLWSREEDIIPVAKEVLQLADPLERECLELLQQAQELAAEFDAVRASKDKRRQFDGAIDLNKNLSKAYVVLEGLQQRAGDVRPGSTLAAAETQLNDLHTEVRKVLMTDQAIKRLMKGQQSA